MDTIKKLWHCAIFLLAAAAILPSLRDTLLQSGARAFLACLGLWYSAEVAYKIFIYPFYVSPLRHLPGPKNHDFLLGQSLNQFRTGDPREPYLTWMRQYPNERFIRFMGVGNTEGLLVTQLDAFKEIFQTKAYSFMKPGFNTRVIIPIVGVGVAFSDGDEHKSQRKLLSPPFALGNMKRLVPMFQGKSKELCQHFNSLIQGESEVINVSSAYARVTIDIVAWFTFGVDLETTLRGSVFHECFQQVSDPSTFGLILVAINGFFPAVRSLPLEENRRFKTANDRVRSTIREMIRKRVTELSQNKSNVAQAPDLLTHMILESRIAGDPWPEEKIVHNVLNFLFAGHETTAQALVWATHALGLYPDIQERVREEALELLARKPNPDYMGLESLHYLDNFLKESLRLYAPAILAAREPVHDVEVCGTVLPKGTSLMMIPTVINRNPAIWGADADEFNPDRWDHLTGQATDPHAMSSFLFGPRQCIGRVFAMLEMKMVLIEVLSKFRFETVVAEEDIKLVNPSPALRQQGGLNVRLHRLNA